jgi:hypothetical protein
MYFKKIATIDEAVARLTALNKKVDVDASDNTYGWIDGKKYSEQEVIALANSVSPATWG